MKKTKLVVLSEDALTDADMPYLKTLPNFRRYLAGGAEIRHVTSVYPSITYPCHVTMVTGVYPDRHGVVSNMPFYLPGEKQVPWLWYHDAVRAPDLFSLAHGTGYSTAAVFWPCTGNHPDIDYLIDEIWSHGEFATGRAAFAASGTGEALLRDVVAAHDGFRERRHPEADTFVLQCAADILRRYAPDLLFLHPAQIDDYRHKNGLYAPKVADGLREADEHIGLIGRTLDECGLLEKTNFVLTSDHGQLDIDRICCPNYFLKNAGLITTDGDRVADWTAVCNSSGMCAFVYVKGTDKDTLARVRRALEKAVPFGVGDIYDAGEAAALGLAGGFSFVLETDGRTSFGDGWTSAETPVTPDDFRLSRATHGFRPDKGPMPVFYAKGPDFAAASVNYASLVDIAPTLAACLGLDMPSACGRTHRELLA